MKGTSNYAPPRKGISHGNKSDRIGTKKYYLHYYQNEKVVITNTHFDAEDEDEAGKKALEICEVEKGDAEWEYIHECSRNRGYEIQVPNGKIQLFHILRD